KREPDSPAHRVDAVEAIGHCREQGHEVREDDEADERARTAADDPRGWHRPLIAVHFFALPLICVQSKYFPHFLQRHLFAMTKTTARSLQLGQVSTIALQGERGALES